MEGRTQILRLKDQLEQKSCEANYLGIQILNCVKEQINNDEQKHKVLIEILKLRKQEEQILIEINDCLDLVDNQKEQLIKNQQNDLTIQSLKQQIMKLNLQLQRIQDLMQDNQHSTEQCEIVIIESQEFYLNKKSYIENLQDQLGKLDIQLVFDLVEKQQNSQILENLQRNHQDLLQEMNELEILQTSLQSQLQEINETEKISQQEQEQINKNLNQLNSDILSIRSQQYIEQNIYSFIQQQTFNLMRQCNHKQNRTLNQKINKSQQSLNQNCQKLILFDLEKMQLNENNYKNIEQESESLSLQMTIDTSFSKNDQDLEFLSQQHQNDLEADLEKYIQSTKLQKKHLQFLSDQSNQMKSAQQNLLLQLQEKVQEQDQLKIQSQELQNKLVQVNLNKCQNKQNLIKVQFKIDQETDKQRSSLVQKTCQKVTMVNQAEDLFQQRLIINQQIKNLLDYQQEMLLLKIDNNSIIRQKSKMIEKMKLLKSRLNNISSDCNQQITKNNHRLNQLHFELQNNQELIEEFLRKNLLFGQIRQDLNIKIQNLKLRQVALTDEIKSVYGMINELDKTQLQQIIESHNFEQLKRI